MTFTLSGELVLTLLLNVALIALAWGTMRTQVAHLVEKARGHDALATSLTELQVEMKHMREAMNKQPETIGLVVAAAIRETLRLVAPSLMASKG